MSHSDNLSHSVNLSHFRQNSHKYTSSIHTFTGTRLCHFFQNSLQIPLNPHSFSKIRNLSKLYFDSIPKIVPNIYIISVTIKNILSLSTYTRY